MCAYISKGGWLEFSFVHSTFASLIMLNGHAWTRCDRLFKVQVTLRYGWWKFLFACVCEGKALYLRVEEVKLAKGTKYYGIASGCVENLSKLCTIVNHYDNHKCCCILCLHLKRNLSIVVEVWSFVLARGLSSKLMQWVFKKNLWDPD